MAWLSFDCGQVWREQFMPYVNVLFSNVMMVEGSYLLILRVSALWNASLGVLVSCLIPIKDTPDCLFMVQIRFCSAGRMCHKEIYF